MSEIIEIRSLIGILRGILSDLNKLTDEQLQALINNEAKFKYFDENTLKGGKKTNIITKEEIEEIVDFLNKCESIEDAKSYLEKQKQLTVYKLQEIAKYINIPRSSKKKSDIIKALVDITVRARLSYESIQRT